MNRSIFLKKKNFKKNIKSFSLNFGPQHPAAHGVMRLILKLNGEFIEDIDTHIGLLHRGTEKLIERRSYILSIPYFDRLDYVSMLIQEHAYCLSIEKILNKNKYFESFNLIRTLYDELTRILNHLMAIGSHTLDLGSMAPIFWAFEERENIMEFYERVSGARMHAAFYRPNKMNMRGVTLNLFYDILFFIKNTKYSIIEINNLIIYNKIWKQRLVNIGYIDKNDALLSGLSGVMLRSSGIMHDIRLNIGETYASYYYLNIKSFCGINGDSYDRYLIRINEINESLSIINKCIEKILDKKESDYDSLLKFFEKKWKKNPYKNMESMINHFKYWSEGIRVNANEIYTPVESPKGEFGVYLISDNSNKPYRCKIKSPGYYSLQYLKKMSKGHMLSDLVALIGSIDIVFGEIDR